MADLTANYQAQLQALLPPGRVFNGEPDTEIAQYLELLAGWFSDLDARAQNLLTEMDPRSTSELLGEWEESLALPDSCTTGVSAVVERRRDVVAKLTDHGGARIARYIGLATAMGYGSATTKRLGPATCRGKCNAALWEPEARFAWVMALGSGTKITIATAASKCNEALRSGGDAVLECVIGRENPVVADVYFDYGVTT